MVKWIKFENISWSLNSDKFCQLPNLQSEANPCYVARVHLGENKTALGYVTQIHGSTKFYFNYYKDDNSRFGQFTKEVLTRDPTTERLTWSPIVDCTLPLSAIPAGCENGRRTYICIRRKAADSGVLFCQKTARSLQKSKSCSLEVLCLAGHRFQVNIAELKRQQRRSFAETHHCCIILFLFLALLFLHVYVYLLLLAFDL